MITAMSFDTGKPGHNLLITATVHGNEPCGYHACQRVIQQIEKGALRLESGAVTFLPCCNPLAFEQNKRYIDENLARMLKYYPDPQTNEQHCANAILPHLGGKTAILDIHSGAAEDAYFVFQDGESQDYWSLAESLGAPLVVHGWTKLYDEIGADIATFAQKLNIPAVVVECGQHEDPQAPLRAEEAIYRFLNLYGLINYDAVTRPTRHIQMHSLIIKEREGQFTQNRKNGQAI